MTRYGVYHFHSLFVGLLLGYLGVSRLRAQSQHQRRQRMALIRVSSPPHAEAKRNEWMMVCVPWNPCHDQIMKEGWMNEWMKGRRWLTYTHTYIHNTYMIGGPTDDGHRSWPWCPKTDFWFKRFEIEGPNLWVLLWIKAPNTPIAFYFVLPFHPRFIHVSSTF